MQTREHRIVSGGGWLIRRTVGRPKARLFAFVSVLWLFVAIPASLLFWSGLPEALSGTAWLCLSLVVLEPVFVVLAVGFWICERRRTIVSLQPNPDYDHRNLY